MLGLSNLFKNRYELLRFLLTAIGVIVSLSLPWYYLREAETRALIWLIRQIGIHVIELGSTTFSVKSHIFSVTAACTNIEAIVGSIPLLWSVGWGIRESIIRFMKYFLVIQLISLARITIGFFFYDKGFSWQLTHEIPAGFLYFIWVIWITKFWKRNGIMGSRWSIA